MAHELSDGQQLALDQIAEISDYNGACRVTGQVSGRAADGSISVEILLDCSGTRHAPTGIALRRREPFVIRVPSEFPFAIPTVLVPHLRWAGTPHVQWGRQLCLYAAPSVEWIPADGIPGLIQRLIEWLERAARGELDPDAAPLHPPVAYSRADAGVVVIRADIGSMAPPARPPQRSGGSASATRSHSARLAVAVCELHEGSRFDAVEWISVHDWLSRYITGSLTNPAGSRRLAGALAILADDEAFFEYPNQVIEVVAALKTLGLDRSEFLDALAAVAAVNYLLATPVVTSGLGSAPLRILIGTPSRRLLPGGEMHQHFVCWQLDDIGQRIAQELIWKESPDDVLADIGRRMAQLAEEWIKVSSITWVDVMEARHEVTIRRDKESPERWISGRRVLIFGAGALGAPAAEHCLRAGARTITIVDSGRVTPGILVRQPYADADIHRPKAEALAERLNRLMESTSVVGVVASAQSLLQAHDNEINNVDIVIDATADAAVASLMERSHATNRAVLPDVISLMVGHDARRGIVAVCRKGATGASRDVLRRLGLAAHGHYRERLADIAEDLFPKEPRTALFQPEPGCSSPTFIGSSAELAALAGHLLDAALGALGQSSPEGAAPMAAGVVRLNSSGNGPRLPGVDWLEWPNDDVVTDRIMGYEVRLSRSAVSYMRAECCRGVRLRGRAIETGGTIFGRIDDACRCIWIDHASGPPPDSRLSALHFDHGVEGLKKLIDYHRQQSGLETTYLGMWHSHPDGVASPSPTDESSMHDLVSEAVGGPPRALMVILGGDSTTWDHWLSGDGLPELFATVIRRQKLGPKPSRPAIPLSHGRAAWSGGWTTTRPEALRPRARSWISRLFSRY